MTNKWGKQSLSRMYERMRCAYIRPTDKFDGVYIPASSDDNIHGITYLDMSFLCQSSIVTNYSHYDNSKIKNNKKWVQLSPAGAPHSLARSLATKHWLPYARTGGGKRGANYIILCNGAVRVSNGLLSTARGVTNVKHLLQIKIANGDCGVVVLALCLD